MKFEWKGVFPALNTYFSADEELDLSLFEKNLNAQLHAGAEGVIIGGSLGEASVITSDEKEKLVRFSLQKLKGKLPVVLNIAEGSTRQAVQQAQFAKQWGVDGLMILPPMRYSSDPRETVTYMKAIAESVNLPIMIYNNPIDYKTEITLDMFEELQSFDNIQAVKESTRDVANVTRMINRFGKRFKILCGVDTLALEEILMGADGWVAGLVDAFPTETVAVYRLAKAGRIEEAREIFRWFLPLLELDIHPKLVQYIKLAAALTGLGSEFVRPPRLALIGEERERIIKIIQDGLASKPILPDYLNA
jgi:dihydrodipicolinate synthase/N-acetylneuraminate lyase